MNQIQILSALNNPTFYNAKKYAAKLVTLLNLAKELRQMEGFKPVFSEVCGNVQLVKDMPVLSPLNYYSKGKYNEAVTSQNFCRDIYGEFDFWQVIVLNHNAGSYSFPLPVNTKFYSLFMEFIGIETAVNVAKEKPLHSVSIPGEVLQTIGKAVKFISKDNLRPALTGVCLKIKDNKLQIAATDCHKLFYSPLLDCNDNDGTYIIPADAAKKLAKVKTKKDEFVTLNIFDNDKAEFAGVEFSFITDAKFPDYAVVIPEYNTYMQFDRVQFITNLKQVVPYSNRSTNQVKLHLNGSIALHCEDVDFSFEADREMNYTSKNFPDFDIAFNGNFLIDIMNVFKDKEIKMYHNGQSSTKAGTFTDGKDNVLCMPLYI